MTLLEQLKRDIEAAEILSSFGCRFVSPSSDSLSGSKRPAYLIFDGSQNRLTGTHFAETELQSISAELDEAFCKILRCRSAEKIKAINAATMAPPP